MIFSFLFLKLDEIKEEILTKKNFMKSQTEFLSVANSNIKSDKMPRWMIARLKYQVLIFEFLISHLV